MLITLLLGAALAAEPEVTSVEVIDPVVAEQEAIRRSPTDFTAYTLEGGEVRIGLLGLGFGLFPRVQIGTIPLLDAFGVYNGNAKWNFLRLGPVDLAASGSHYFVQTDSFQGRMSTVGADLSVRVLPRWSVHGGASYARGRGVAQADLVDLALLIDDDADILRELGVDGETSPRFAGDLVQLRVATDLQVTKRGSLVLQAQASPFGRVATAGGPAPLGLDEVYTAGGEMPVTSTYVASISWQQTWKNVDLRVGGGASAVPFLWLVQATDVALRFGGAERPDREVRAADVDER